MDQVHAFSVDLATKIGLEESIILNHFIFWDKKYRSNHDKSVENNHFHDGLYWFYSSVKTWNESYPYLTESKIKRVLINLETMGYIKAGNFNKFSYDRTKWYSLTSLSPISENHQWLAKNANGLAKNANDISDNSQCDSLKSPTNTFYNTVESTVESTVIKAATKVADVVEFDFDKMGSETTQAVKDWIEYRRSINRPIKTQVQMDNLRKQLWGIHKGSCDGVNKMRLAIQHSISNGYQGLFEAKYTAAQQKLLDKKQQLDDYLDEVLEMVEPK